ncbi:MAG: hypothetical protein J6Y74_03505 [Clostridia bacterium]|nr:hypothetical protein [Clostridia bacterium]
MEIKGTKDSHIQIPKSLLKPFSTPVSIVNSLGFKETPDMVFKMDMEGTISQESIKEANTEYGYYDDFIETSLLKSIEDAFGDFKANLLKSVKANVLPVFSPSDIVIVQKFCSLCIIRSQSVVNDIKKKSVFMDFLADAPQNVVVYQYFKDQTLVDEYIFGDNISYVKNETELNYILPQFYAIGMEQKDHTVDYFIPISPKVLVRLTSAKTIIGNQLIVGRMRESDVDNLNKFAIKQEFLNNHRAVYAKEKEDLERYVHFIKSLS